MVNRMRHTKGKVRSKRSHHHVEKPAITKSDAGVPHLRHRASLQTGTYRGKQVVDVEKNLRKQTNAAADESGQE